MTPLPALLTPLLESRTAVLVDISSKGARLRGEHLPEMGQALEITVEKIKAFGEVVCTSGNQCGLRFDTPLQAGEVERLRRDSRSVVRKGISPEEKVAFEAWTAGVAR